MQWKNKQKKTNNFVLSHSYVVISLQIETKPFGVQQLRCGDNRCNGIGIAFRWNWADCIPIVKIYAHFFIHLSMFATDTTQWCNKSRAIAYLTLPMEKKRVYVNYL